MNQHNPQTMLARASPTDRIANTFRTHEVTNQPTELRGYNAFETDLALGEAIASQNASWATSELHTYGRITGDELMALGFEANIHKPALKTHDRFGNRLDEVAFHPSYHRIMALGVEHGVSNFAWNRREVGSHVARAALLYLHNQADAGTSCPLTMTHAAIPTLRLNSVLANIWVPKALNTQYDFQLNNPILKSGVTLGMGMTEKQGGSDVRANSTLARFLQTDQYGEVYEVVGHKWFFSAPMGDAFLVLAQTTSGLSCFLMPRMWPDGEQASRNDIRIQRLKDKLGNWSNASAEVEFTGARAWLLGKEGRGIPSILEMVALTRLDCLTGSASLMRQALVQAIHHTRERSAFGKRLVEQSLMENVLADLALESEAAMLLSMRVAYSVDRSFSVPSDPHEAALARLLTAVGKYWVCKRCTPLVNEAQECLGGAGYVEEGMMPRLLREAPLNSIWEGSGNVQCLDVLRAISREPETLEAFNVELLQTKGLHKDLDAAVIQLQMILNSGVSDAAMPLIPIARQIVERMALVFQAHLLLKHMPSFVAHAYCESRLGGGHGAMFGTLGAEVEKAKIIARAFI
jgi:putative acyl-CoA dehydrogenase